LWYSIKPQPVWEQWLIIVDLYQIDATHMVLVDRCEIQSSNITNTTQRFGYLRVQNSTDHVIIYLSFQIIKKRRYQI
jgi:hypothetical protein